MSIFGARTLCFLLFVASGTAKRKKEENLVDLPAGIFVGDVAGNNHTVDPLEASFVEDVFIDPAKPKATCAPDDPTRRRTDRPCDWMIRMSGAFREEALKTCQTTLSEQIGCQPATCNIVDGSAASSAYPCACGTTVCTTGQTCSASTNACQADKAGFEMMNCDSSTCVSPCVDGWSSVDNVPECHAAASALGFRWQGTYASHVMSQGCIGIENGGMAAYNYHPSGVIAGYPSICRQTSAPTLKPTPAVGASIPGLHGRWFTAANVGMSCNEVCSDVGLDFDRVSTTHSGNAAGKFFYPTKHPCRNVDTIECTSVGSGCLWGANGKPADASWRATECLVHCACLVTVTSEASTLGPTSASPQASTTLAEAADALASTTLADEGQKNAKSTTITSATTMSGFLIVSLMFLVSSTFMQI